MKTASFKTYRGDGRISIARWAPRGTPRGFRVFKKLAPGTWFKTPVRADYVRLFQAEVFDVLDPKRTYATLQRMADPSGFVAGKDERDLVEPVLLCWEVPPFTETNWCHRRMVAEWFENALGIEVPEMTTEQAAEKPEQQNLKLDPDGDPGQQVIDRVDGALRRRGLV